MDHVQRVKDLLELAASATISGEREQATAMAAKLMAKFSITEAQAHAHGQDEELREIAEMEIMVPPPFARLKAMRASQVAKIFGAKTVILKPSRTPATKAKGVWGLALFASPESADSVQALLSLLWIQLDRVAGLAMQEQERLTTAHKRGIVNGWFATIIDRLKAVYREAAAEAEAHTPGTDLVLRRDSELAEEAKNNAFPVLRQMTTNAAIDVAGFIHGRREGQKADIGITAAAEDTAAEELESGLITCPGRVAMVDLIGEWVRLVLEKPSGAFGESVELAVRIESVEYQMSDPDDSRSFVVSVVTRDDYEGILFGDIIASVVKVDQDPTEWEDAR